MISEATTREEVSNRSTISRKGRCRLLLWVLTGIAWLYLFSEACGNSSFVNFANLAGPLLLGIAALGTAIQLVTRHPAMMWTPYAWFFVFIILFCSMGPLLYPLADRDTVQLVNSFIPVNSSELLRTNLLNAVGILAVLLGFRIFWEILVRFAKKPGERSLRPMNLRRVALVFLVVGGLLRFLLILPHDFGLIPVVLPGVLVSIGDLFLLGLMILAYLVAKGDRRLRIPFYALWIIQIVTAFLTFSKTSLFLSIILPVAGSYFGNHKSGRLVIWALICVAIFFSLENFIGYARDEVNILSNHTARATLAQRVHITVGWFLNPHANRESGGSSFGTGWARLDYATVQTFAMTRYDEGYPGHTLRDAAIIFIPRLFWPEKPVVTNMGAQFYQLVTGHRGSQLGLGIFGEGYWDGGWIGVIGLAFLTGAVFAWLSHFTEAWMRHESLEYLPSVFIGIFMASIGISALFVPAVMGGAAFFAVYAGLIWFLKQLMGIQRST